MPAFSQDLQKDTSASNVDTTNWVLREAAECFTEVEGLYQQMDSLESINRSYEASLIAQEEQTRLANEAFSILRDDAIPKMKKSFILERQNWSDKLKISKRVNTGLGISLPVAIGLGIAAGFLIAYK